MSKAIDITNQRFGRLIALEKVVYGKDPKWLCKCDCGNKKTIYQTALRRGLTQSCGCLQKELAGDRYRKPLDDVYNELKEKGYEFIEWIEKYIDAKSKFKAKNTKGIEFITCMDQIRKIKNKNIQFYDGRMLCNGKKVYEDFINKGLNPMFEPKDYSGYNQKLPFICTNHEVIGIQYKTYNVLKNTDFPCKYCYYDSLIKEENHVCHDGVKLKDYLRDIITVWKRDTLFLCRFTCVITNAESEVIHHLHSFKDIFDEVFFITNYSIHSTIGEYTKDELLIISKLCIDLHKKYGMGVCLNKQLHKLFHSKRGYRNRNNTKEQFGEFVTRLEQGEFSDFLKDNNLELNINYEVINKLLKNK